MFNVWPALLLVLLQGSLTPDDAGVRLAILRGMQHPAARAAIAHYWGPSQPSTATVAPTVPSMGWGRSVMGTGRLVVGRALPAPLASVPAPGHSPALRWRDGPTRTSL